MTRPDLYHDLFAVAMPPGAGRERVAAMVEAITGMSLFGPCHSRAWRQDRALRVAEARAALGTSKPRRPRKPPTLANVAKQASKAAIAVARYEIKPDGTIVVVTGQGEQQQGNELDEWIAKHARTPERH